jgi:hypothetical protein
MSEFLAVRVSVTIATQHTQGAEIFVQSSYDFGF